MVTQDLAAVAATLILDRGVFELVMYTLAGDLVTNIIVYVFIGSAYGFAKPDFSVIGPALKFGLPLLPAGFAVWGLNYVDRVFLVKYGTMADVGVYSFAYSLGYMVIVLLARPFRMMYPPLATAFHDKRQVAEHQRIFNYSAGTVLALTIPGMVGLWVLRDPIVAVLAPPEFAAAAPLIALVTMGYIFTVMASYYEIHLGLLFRQHWYTISVTAAFVVNLILNFLLIPRYLILGAAIATTASFMIQFLISFFVSRQAAVVKTDWMFLAEVVIASAVMGQILVMARALLFPGPHNLYLELALMLLLGTLIYAVLIVLTGTVPRENVHTVFRQLGLRRS